MYAPGRSGTFARPPTGTRRWAVIASSTSHPRGPGWDRSSKGGTAHTSGRRGGAHSGPLYRDPQASDRGEARAVGRQPCVIQHRRKPFHVRDHVWWCRSCATPDVACSHAYGIPGLSREANTSLVVWRDSIRDLRVHHVLGRYERAGAIRSSRVIGSQTMQVTRKMVATFQGKPAS